MNIWRLVGLQKVAFGSATRVSRNFKKPVLVGHRAYTAPAGTPGSGAGRGGGGGGSIKESGGGLGRYGVAQEEGYFYNKNREQLTKLKKEGKDEKPKETSQKPEGE